MFVKVLVVLWLMVHSNALELLNFFNVVVVEISNPPALVEIM